MHELQGFAASERAHTLLRAERITVNIQQFSEEISDIYAATFKPLMDILLFTYKLAHATNNRGPIILFSYFAFSSLLKIVSTPDFGKVLPPFAVSSPVWPGFLVWPPIFGDSEPFLRLPPTPPA
jgi:hypothetical protein